MCSFIISPLIIYAPFRFEVWIAIIGYNAWFFTRWTNPNGHFKHRLLIALLVFWWQYEFLQSSLLDYIGPKNGIPLVSFCTIQYPRSHCFLSSSYLQDLLQPLQQNPSYKLALFQSGTKPVIMRLFFLRDDEGFVFVVDSADHIHSPFWVCARMRSLSNLLHRSA